MDVTELENLVALVQKSNVRELTLRQGEARITIRKAALPVTESFSASYAHVSHVFPEHSSEERELSLDTAAEDSEREKVGFITSPLVGVFHHVSPVVGLGAVVKSGQTVGVIESMNLVHEVEAVENGVVTDVLIEDGVVVEYGQRLFALRAD